MKKKFLVTGAMGFVGSHWVKKLLSEGYEVTGIDIKPLDKFFKKIKNSNSLKHQYLIMHC